MHNTNTKGWLDFLTYLPVCHGGRSSNLAVFLIDALASGSAKTQAKHIQVGILGRLFRCLRRTKSNVAALKAALLACRRGVWHARTRDVLGS
jgi:hypothetical protein